MTSSPFPVSLAPPGSSSSGLDALYLECWSILTPYRKSGKMGTLYRVGFEKSVRDGRFYLVLNENGLLLGFMQLSVKKRLLCLSVDRVAVRKTSLRKGIGTQLLAVAKAQADAKSMPLRLRVANTNSDALAFYTALGFQPVETSALTTALVLR